MTLRTRTIDTATRDELAKEVTRLTDLLRLAEDRLLRANAQIDAHAAARVEVMGAIDAHAAVVLRLQLLLKKLWEGK